MDGESCDFALMRGHLGIGTQYQLRAFPDCVPESQTRMPTQDRINQLRAKYEMWNNMSRQISSQRDEEIKKRDLLTDPVKIAAADVKIAALDKNANLAHNNATAALDKLNRALAGEDV